MQTSSSQWTPPSLPKGTRIAIVRSSWHENLTQSMEESAKRVLADAGVKNILTFTVPGAFEIPLVCKNIIREKRVAGIVALGVIIQGETHHAAEIARACTDGIMHVMLQTGVPIAHGVLFTDSMKQAEDRTMGTPNKGSDVATTLLRMVALRK